MEKRHRETAQLVQHYRNDRKEESKQGPRAVAPSEWNSQAWLMGKTQKSLGGSLAMLGSVGDG